MTKKTLATLAAAHDRKIMIPNRIRAALAALRTGGEEWEYELDFIKLAKPPISCADISKFRDQFVDFWSELPSTTGRRDARRVWFATAALKLKWEQQLDG